MIDPRVWLLLSALLAALLGLAVLFHPGWLS